MKYNCEPCSYFTNISSNYKRHVRSNNHAKKVQELNNNIPDNNNSANSASSTDRVAKKYFCNKCDTEFSHASSLSRHIHQNRCKSKIENPKRVVQKIQKREDESEYLTRILDLELRLRGAEDRANLYRDTLEDYKKSLDDYKKIVENNSFGNTYKVSVKNYIQQNYNDAPPLTSVKNYKYLGHKTWDDLIETIISKYDNGVLDSYLADQIVINFKKEDPQKQSVWNSDISRLTYIVRVLVDNNKLVWNRDPDGTVVREKIVKPMLRYIRTYIEAYEELDFDALYKDDRMRSLAYIKRMIDEKILENQIIRKMAPHFYLAYQPDVGNKKRKSYIKYVESKPLPKRKDIAELDDPDYEFLSDSEETISSSEDEYIEMETFKLKK